MLATPVIVLGWSVLCRSMEWANVPLVKARTLVVRDAMRSKFVSNNDCLLFSLLL